MEKREAKMMVIIDNLIIMKLSVTEWTTPPP
jgi:hypothetical protein